MSPVPSRRGLRASVLAVGLVTLAGAAVACQPSSAPANDSPVPRPGEDDVTRTGSNDCGNSADPEGCRCSQSGATRACWPGDPEQRGRSGCRDGVSTCVRDDEEFAWGPCEGAVLSCDGGDGSCFSSGRWDIDNTTLCIQGRRLGGVLSDVAISSTPYTTQDCYDPAVAQRPPIAWSRHRITADCPGAYTLCFTVRAGDASRPAASDCVLAESCVDVDYDAAGRMQELPELPSWLADRSCSAEFYTGGGYAELSVRGTTRSGEEVGRPGAPRVIKRVPYCSGNGAGCTSQVSGTF